MMSTGEMDSDIQSDYVIQQTEQAYIMNTSGPLSFLFTLSLSLFLCFPSFSLSLSFWSNITY